MDEKTSQTETSTRLEAEIAALKTDVTQLRDDISALTEALKEAAAGYASEAGERVSEGAAAAGDKVSEQIEQAVGAGRKVMDELEGQISQKPIVSLLTAASVGFIIAKLLDLGRRR